LTRTNFKQLIHLDDPLTFSTTIRSTLPETNSDRHCVLVRHRRSQFHFTSR
jgi:hypothetical protein